MRRDEYLDNGNIRLRFSKTGRDTQGELLEMEATYHPSSLRPPAHYHPKQEETFRIVAGALQIVVDGRERVVSAGESVVIPPGCIHAANNAVSEETQVIWQVRPALRTQQFFETLYGLAAAGKTNSSGAPNVLQMAVIAKAYRDEFVLASPPRLIQNCIFGILAPIARALGYRAEAE
jgi:mannose-6-phosphate isomerase-like protein (cupin superfamily)